VGRKKPTVFQKRCQIGCIDSSTSTRGWRPAGSDWTATRPR